LDPEVPKGKREERKIIPQHYPDTYNVEKKRKEKKGNLLPIRPGGGKQEKGGGRSVARISYSVCPATGDSEKSRGRKGGSRVSLDGKGEDGTAGPEKKKEIFIVIESVSRKGR